jgi:hypothetical protein
MCMRIRRSAYLWPAMKRSGRGKRGRDAPEAVSDIGENFRQNTEGEYNILNLTVTTRL